MSSALRLTARTVTGECRNYCGAIARRLLAAVIFCLVVVIVLFHWALTTNGPRPGTEAPPTPTLSVQTAGRAEVVFNWASERCSANDVPDTSARAFKGPDGGVELIAGNYVNRIFSGPNLAHLRHSCVVVLNSTYNPNPSAFDDREWIASTWATGNATVYALIHEEYQGSTHPGHCPSGSYLRCWYNAITFGVSHDGGRTFATVPGVIATVSARYTPDKGPEGLFNPTNIVRSHGYFYVLAHLNIRDKVYGECLLRTTSLSQTGSWRAWSADATFTTRFIDPYSKATPDRLCRPVSPRELGDLLPGSITYSSAAREWVLVGAKEGGIFYSLSADLIHWSSLRRLYSTPVSWTYRCGKGNPVNYPSLIDPSSTTRNFQTVGHSAFLYLTLFHPTSCRLGPDRDLIRIPVTLSIKK